MSNELKLEELVGKLLTHRGKLFAYGIAAENGIVKSQEYLEKGITSFVELEWPYRAASLAKKAGLRERSAELFLKSGIVSAAADVFVEANEIDKALEILEKNDIFPSAAELSIKYGLFDRAKENYKKAKSYKKAADLAFNLTMYSEASQLYEMAGFLKHAYASAKRTDNLERIADLEKRVKVLPKGIDSLPKSIDEWRLWSRFIGLRIRTKLLLDYGISFGKIRLSDEESAAKRKEFTLAGEIAEAHGSPNAGFYYEKAGQSHDAKRFYLEKRDFFNLGNIQLRQGRYQEAIINFEQSGAFASAAEAARQMGDGNREKMYTQLHYFVHGNGFLEKLIVPNKQGSQKFFRALGEAGIAGLLTISQDIFNSALNPRKYFSPKRNGEYQNLPPLSNNIDLVSDGMHDFTQAFVFSWIAYNALDLLLPKLSDKVKMTAAGLIVNIPNVAYKSGLFQDQQTDYIDIGFKMGGTLAYLMANKLLRKPTKILSDMFFHRE